MGWSRLVLKESLEPEIDAAWRAAWHVAHEGNKPSHGHAVFRASGPGKSLILYFSPLEQELAETFGAKPCDKPEPAGLRLVAGHVRAWETYFPGTVQQITRLRKGAYAFDSVRLTHSPGVFAPTHPFGVFEPTHPSQITGL